MQHNEYSTVDTVQRVQVRTAAHDSVCIRVDLETGAVDKLSIRQLNRQGCLQVVLCVSRANHLTQFFTCNLDMMSNTIPTGWSCVAATHRHAVVPPMHEYAATPFIQPSAVILSPRRHLSVRKRHQRSRLGYSFPLVSRSGLALLRAAPIPLPSRSCELRLLGG